MVNFEPAVGRYLLKKASSFSFYPWYEEGGLITRVSGKRVYYKDAQGNEKFTHEYSGVADTPEEVDRLLDFTARGKSMTTALKAELAAMEIEALEPPPVKRKRTSKAAL